MSRSKILAAVITEISLCKIPVLERVCSPSSYSHILIRERIDIARRYIVGGFPYAVEEHRPNSVRRCERLLVVCRYLKVYGSPACIAPGKRHVVGSNGLLDEYEFSVSVTSSSVVERRRIPSVQSIAVLSVPRKLRIDFQTFSNVRGKILGKRHQRLRHYVVVPHITIFVEKVVGVVAVLWIC